MSRTKEAIRRACKRCGRVAVMGRWAYLCASCRAIRRGRRDKSAPRPCNLCGRVVLMGRFERFCVPCKRRAAEMEHMRAHLCGIPGRRLESLRREGWEI